MKKIAPCYLMMMDKKRISDRVNDGKNDENNNNNTNHNIIKLYSW